MIREPDLRSPAIGSEKIVLYPRSARLPPTPNPQEHYLLLLGNVYASNNYAILWTSQLNKSFTGFLRINPASAPINPPGTAPTLTTVYRETNAKPPSEFESPATSQDLPVAKSEKKRRRLKFNHKPAPASHGIDGTEMELRRVQTIADSLDLGQELGLDLGGGPDVGYRTDHGEPNRVVKKEDARLDRWREDVTSGMPVGKRRSVG